MNQVQVIVKDKRNDEDLQKAVYESFKELADASVNLIAASRIVSSTYHSPNAKATLDYFKMVLSSKIKNLQNLCRVINIMIHF